MDRAARAILNLIKDLNWFSDISNHHDEAVALKARIVIRNFLQSDDARILLTTDDGN